MNSNLIKRFLSAIIAFPLLMVVVGYGGLPFQLLMTLVTGIALREYARMAISDANQRPMYILLGTSVFGLAVLGITPPEIQVMLVNGAVILLCIQQVARPGEIEKAWPELGLKGLGFVYILVPHILLCDLRQVTYADTFMSKSEETTIFWVVFTMLVTWGADTGAYFAGRAFGRTPLHPVISPKKTREGLYGGILLSIIVGMLYSYFSGVRHDLFLIGGISAVGALVSVFGDLTESMLKRTYKIKDSGTIMPGHGGLLDRVDGLYFSVVWIWLAFNTFIK